MQNVSGESLNLIRKTKMTTDVSQTAWQVEPSFKYDVFCFLNSLTGDPFYLPFYQAEYEKFEPKLTSQVRLALKSLKTRLKDEGKTIISAQLCLYYSVVEAETLDQLIEITRDNTELKKNLRQTIYWDEKGWQEFDSVKTELVEIFTFLKELNFEDYWRENLLPGLTERIAVLKTELAQYDVVAEVEKKLGAALPSHTIIVYVLYYTKPHGIKITGTRFITSPDWGTNIVVRTAGHEMMHPPFDLANSPELQQAIENLKQDPFLMQVFDRHDPSFGYNTVEGLLDEDCVQALDQLIAEELGTAAEPRQRWKKSDEGLHVFAACLYSLLKEEGYGSRPSGEQFQAHLLKLMRTRLLPGHLKTLYDKFYVNYEG
jgi:hypothetical protein